MRIFKWIGRVTRAVVVGGVTGTVALTSRLLDGTIELVGRSSERLDAKLGALAHVSEERRRQQGRRPIDPITLQK